MHSCIRTTSVSKLANQSLKIKSTCSWQDTSCHNIISVMIMSMCVIGHLAEFVGGTSGVCGWGFLAGSWAHLGENVCLKTLFTRPLQYDHLFLSLALDNNRWAAIVITQYSASSFLDGYRKFKLACGQNNEQ